MKVQIIYTSLTGCTRRVAQAIFDGIEAEEKSIHDLADGVPELDGDVILFGYWGVSGHPCFPMIELMQSVQGKAVGVFATLGYYADSAHARDTLVYALDLLKDRNEVIGSYVCSGAIAQKLKDGQGLGAPHTPTAQKEVRWEVHASHPTQAECALAAERFRERLFLYRRCQALHIPFTSII